MVSTLHKQAVASLRAKDPVFGERLTMHISEARLGLAFALSNHIEEALSVARALRSFERQGCVEQAGEALVRQGRFDEPPAIVEEISASGVQSAGVDLIIRRGDVLIGG